MNIANDIYDAMAPQINLKVEAQNKVEELNKQIQQKDLRISQLTEELKNTKIELLKTKNVKE